MLDLQLTITITIKDDLANEWNFVKFNYDRAVAENLFPLFTFHNSKQNKNAIKKYEIEIIQLIQKENIQRQSNIEYRNQVAYEKETYKMRLKANYKIAS